MKKNYSSLIKLIVASVAVGETIASYYNDKTFKESLDNAKGFEKCKVIFNNLLSINKAFFTDIKSVDYNNITNEYKELFYSRLNLIGEKIDLLKEEIEKVNNEKFKPLVDKLISNYEKIKSDIDLLKEDAILKYGDKLELLEKKIFDLKKQLELKIKEYKNS